MSSNFSYVPDSNLYSEAYYNFDLNTMIEKASIARNSTKKPNEPFNGVDRTFLLIRFITTLLLRIGINLIQIANIATVRSANIVIKNLMNLVLGSITYLFLGIGIGQSIWIFRDTLQMEDAIKGWSVSTIASAFTLTLTNNRIPFFISELIMFVYNTAIVPLLILWTWTEDGFMAKNKLGAYNVQLNDFGGALCVHISGSLLGIVGVLSLGRRLVRLRDIEEYIFKTDSILHNILGYSFILPGLVALSIPQYENENSLGVFFLNNIVASATSILTVCSIQRIHFIFVKEAPRLQDYWTMVRYFQSGVAGIVAVAAGVLIYHPGLAVVFGLLGGLVFYLIDYLIAKTYIEDNCNIIAIHYFCASLSMLFPPFYKKFIVMELLWALICWFIVNVFIILISVILFFTLAKLNWLRTHEEAIYHQRAVILQANTNQRGGLKRLVTQTDTDLTLKPGDDRHILSLIDPQIKDESRKKKKSKSKKDKMTKRSDSDFDLFKKNTAVYHLRRYQSEMIVASGSNAIVNNTRMHQNLGLSSHHCKRSNQNNSLILNLDLEISTRGKCNCKNDKFKFNNVNCAGDIVQIA